MAVIENVKPVIRTLSLFTAFMLVLTNIIGSGVFKKVAPMSAELMSPGLVLLGWLIAGVITLIGALTNAEIAGLIPEQGGQYAYFRKMYGKTFAFFYGWSAFAVVQSATIASIAYVFSESLNTLVTLPSFSEEIEQITLGGIFYPFDNFGVKCTTIGLISLLTFVNYRGLKYGGLLATVLGSTVVICIFTIIVAGLTFGNGSFENITTNSVNYDPATLSGGGLIAAMFAAMMSAFWAYEGWNSMPFLGTEIKNPSRNIPLALMYGVGLVIVIYLLINFTYLYVLPVDDLIAVHKSENAIAAVAVVKSFMGNGGGLFISILILIATFSTTNATTMTAARIYCAMASKGNFFRKAAYIHPTFGTPSNALLYQGIWASVLVLSGSFDQLTDMLIFAAFIFYGAGAFGVFVLRRKMKDVPRTYKVIGYPVVPALFVLFCAALVTVTLYNSPREAVIGLSLIALGLPFYLFWQKKNEKLIAEADKL